MKAVSGNVTISTMNRYMDKPLHGYIKKPLTIERIGLVVKEELEK